MANDLSVVPNNSKSNRQLSNSPSYTFVQDDLSVNLLGISDPSMEITLYINRFSALRTTDLYIKTAKKYKRGVCDYSRYGKRFVES